MQLAPRLLLLLSLAAPLLVAACDATPTREESDFTQKSSYGVDVQALGGLYGKTFQSFEDAYTVKVKAGDLTVPAPTHLFGAEMNVIAYADEDGAKTADGEVFGRGDQEIAKVFKRGQIGIAVKNHRAKLDVLDLSSADPTQMKEHFKLQDTHIGIVVGVERDGQPGAITLNNPQGYEGGKFGSPTYPMVFLRPVYPSFLDDAAVAAYEKNVLTMMVAFNAVTNFPGDYNGGDPLGARSTERLREYVKNMVLALDGDADARAFFQDDANQVYCSELAFVALSAGVHVPLNDATMIPLVGAEPWGRFKDWIAAHNGGEATPFTTLNKNPRVALIKDLSVADDSLRSIAELAPAALAGKLALEPMTASDIVEQFMRTHLPREILGEQLAPLQGKVLEQMKPGLLESLGMNELPADHPARAAVEDLYARLVETVGKPYGSYAEFRAALEPLLAEARTLTGPRQDDGVGLFVPPSLYHVVAQGKHTGGLFGMQYEGHGVHVSAVRKKSAPVEPTPVDDIPAEATCEESCGRQAPGGCWCDGVCADYGDCCDDRAAHCQ